MFAKLLKYDMRALKKMGMPILIVLLALTVLASVIGFLSTKYFDHSSLGTTSNLGLIIDGFMTLILALGSILTVVLFSMASTVMLVLVCVHFYKNTVSDEGYLTFTLPVKTKDIIFSKLLSGFTWTAIVAIASVVGIFIVFMAVVLGAVDISLIKDFNAEFPAEFKALLSEAFNNVTVGIVFLIVQAVVSIIVMSVFNLMLMYTAIFFGGVITKKNKGLAAIGCVIGANSILSLFSSFFSMVLMPLIFVVSSVADLITSYNIMLLVSNLAYGGAAVGCYFLLKHMMDKKLNLS